MASKNGDHFIGGQRSSFNLPSGIRSTERGDFPLNVILDTHSGCAILSTQPTDDAMGLQGIGSDFREDDNSHDHFRIPHEFGG
jgi:hypothetical protein